MRALLASGIFVSLVIVVVACGGSTATIADNNAGGGQQVVKQTDGSPTISGSTCSWRGTSFEVGVVTKDPPPTHNVGETFPSLDGCNQCSCTAQGIACTTNACGGTTSSSGASSSGVQGCTTEAMVCPDGKTTVGRTGPSCAFAPCPTDIVDGGKACPTIAKKCPDGTTVGPTGPNCEFVCPTVTCEQLVTSASKEVATVVQAHTKCAVNDDCRRAADITDCYDHCGSGVINKDGVDAFSDVIDRVNNSQCKQYKAQGCPPVVRPPCVAPQPPQCNLDTHTCK